MKKTIGMLLCLVLAVICVFALADAAIDDKNFPDENFREYVKQFDTDEDGNLSEAELAAVTVMEASEKEIADMTGLEHFTSLTELYCSVNQLTSLNVTANAALKIIGCHRNALTSLDLNKNLALEELICDYNQLTALDLSWNTELFHLSCTNNQLAKLDVSGNTALKKLYCYANGLKIGDVTLNRILSDLLYGSEPEEKEDHLLWKKDEDTLLGADKDFVPEGVAIVEQNFPDGNFRACVSEFDQDKNGFLNSDEIAAVTVIEVSEKEISDLKGIEHFTALTELYCSRNLLTSLDVSANKALKMLSCHSNELTALDVNENTALEELICDHNQLTVLDGIANAPLTHLSCTHNKLTSLAVFEIAQLKKLYCYANELTNENIKLNQTLRDLVEGSEPTEKEDHLLWAIDEDGDGENEILFAVDKSYIPEGVAINERNFPDGNFRTFVAQFDTDENGYLNNDEIAAVTVIEVSEKDISDLKGIEHFTALTELYFGRNQVTGVDLSANTALKMLSCHSNELTALDVSANTALEELICDHNRLTDLDVSNNKALFHLSCTNNQLTGLDVTKSTKLKKLYTAENPLKTLDVSKNKALEVLDCSANELDKLTVTANTKLKELYCSRNNLTYLNVTKNTKLIMLSCWQNQLTGLNVDKNTALQELICDNNQLPSLKTGKNKALTHLSCSGNKLKSLDVSKNQKLAKLQCYDNELKKLDVSKTPILNELVKYNEPVKGKDPADKEYLAWRIGENEKILSVDRDVKVVTDAVALSKVTVAAIKDQAYTGKAIKPTVTVKYDGKKLSQGKDYTVSWKNNKKIGKATITLTGKGDYTGTKEVTFNIVPKGVKLSSLTAGKKQLTVKWKKGSNITGYEIEYSTDKKFKKDVNKLTISKAGTTQTVLKKLTAKKTYYVRIRTYKTVGGVKFWSAWSSVMNKKIK